jgi:hypothetical protein
MRTTFRRAVALAALAAVGLSGPAFAVGKDKAAYVGGTVNTLAQGTEGMLGTSDTKKLMFVAEKGGGLVEIPYRSISDVEYGQKVGRRWKSAILLSPVALFMKGRKHFVTITYTDPEKAEQAAVFEIGKDAIRTTLAVIEARTGRKVMYQDEEARKARAN